MPARLAVQRTVMRCGVKTVRFQAPHPLVGIATILSRGPDARFSEETDGITVFISVSPSALRNPNKRSRCKYQGQTLINGSSIITPIKAPAQLQNIASKELGA